MRAIVSVCSDWGIGKSGQLLIENKDDMRFFVQNTKGGIVIMGRKTLESFPQQKPLKNRRNIVLSRQNDLQIEGAEVVLSVQEALNLVENIDPQTVWLIGGASLYKELLPLCSECLVTYHYTQKEADSYFPNLDEMNYWKCVYTSPKKYTENNIAYEFRTYKQIC